MKVHLQLVLFDPNCTFICSFIIDSVSRDQPTQPLIKSRAAEPIFQVLEFKLYFNSNFYKSTTVNFELNKAMSVIGSLFGQSEMTYAFH